MGSEIEDGDRSNILLRELDEIAHHIHIANQEHVNVTMKEKIKEAQFQHRHANGHSHLDENAATYKAQKAEEARQKDRVCTFSYNDSRC